MIMSMNARPAPGTTELLELLDRALGGGIVIDPGHGSDVKALSSTPDGARVVVAAAETYLQHAEAGPTRRSIAPAAERPRAEHTGRPL